MAKSYTVETSVDLGIIDRGSSGQVRVNYSVINGHRVFQLRKWYQAQEGDWRPTREGVTLRIEDLPKLREWIDQLLAEVESDSQKQAA